MQRTLSRAPLGSIGKSLREVVVGVEARLQQLQPVEGHGTTCSRIPSASSKSSAANVHCARGGPTAAGHRQDDLPPPHPGGAGGSWSTRPTPGLPGEIPLQVNWDLLDISECPPSARDGYGGRPTTRDAERSGVAGIRPCTTEGGRPATSDCWRQQSSGLGLAAGLDGTRPSTRDDIRLQHQLDGTRPSARDRKNGSREAFPREPSYIETTPRRPSRENRQSSVEAARPATRDGVRPPTRDSKERRCQDVTIRQVTSRKPSTGKRRQQHQQACEVLNVETGLETVVSASPIPISTAEIDAFGDEGVELLE